MKRWCIAATLWLISACGTANSRHSIILLAPFEGRYREIGYEALYAARLALLDADSSLDLLPIDDGGTSDLAAQRADAFAQLENTPTAVILLGYNATSPDVQGALSPLPALIVGWWGNEAQFSHVSELFPQSIVTRVDEADREPLPELARKPDLDLIGDVGGLLGFARLRLTSALPVETITVISSGRLPDPEFSQRYLNSAPFAPPPRLIASQVYDAVRLIARAASDGTPLIELEDRALTMPLYAYRLDEQGELRLDHIIE
jgi:hypothetical protein